jgi:hypothetical protein
MNDVAATMLCDLTSSMRFDGSLNVDLNEITMNLVPFPRMHYLVPSISPVVGARGAKYLAGGGLSGTPGAHLFFVLFFFFFYIFVYF